MNVSGAVNGDVLAIYLGQVLGPTLVPGLADLVEARCCICRLIRPI